MAKNLVKQSLQRAATSTLAEALDFESHAQAICTTTKDFKEGARAFVEKREPNFSGE